MCFLDQRIQKKMYLILKTEAIWYYHSDYSNAPTDTQAAAWLSESIHKSFRAAAAGNDDSDDADRDWIGTEAPPTSRNDSNRGGVAVDIPAAKNDAAKRGPGVIPSGGTTRRQRPIADAEYSYACSISSVQRSLYTSLLAPCPPKHTITFLRICDAQQLCLYRASGMSSAVMLFSN